MTTPAPIIVAGIDVGKTKLDAQIAEGSLQRQFNTDNCGRRALATGSSSTASAALSSNPPGATTATSTKA